MNKHIYLASVISCLALSTSLAGRLDDFESDTFGQKPAEWIFDGDSSDVTVVNTASSGNYSGGQAIRTDNSGASYAGSAFTGLLVVSLQADFRWDWSSAGTPTLAVYGWDDADNDGFQAGERTIGFGLDNDGQFELTSESGEIAGSTNFAADTWYRLTMTWGEPDGSGNWLVTLTAFDLTNDSDLGVVSSATMTPAEFGVDPSEWDGIAFRMTRGTIDNIQINTEPGPAFTYVDATPANTTINTNPAAFPGGVPLVAGSNYINDGSSGSGSDGLWTYRTDASFSTFEGGTAFESDSDSSPGDGEATADLITTINLPAIGTYEIVAVFTRSSNRDIAAKIGASPDTSNIYDTTNALNADQGPGGTDINFDGSFTNGRGGSSGAAYLGTVTTTTANQEVRIFVNGLANTPADDVERTQYDGIGYRSTGDTPSSDPKHRDVFILAGQSNCDGRGLVAELVGPLSEYAGQQANVLIHYSNLDYTNSNRSLYQKWVTLRPGFSKSPGYSGSLPSTSFGMEIGAARILSEHYPNPAFIKVSQGATALGTPGVDWYPAPLDSPDVGPLFKELIEATSIALGELEAAGDTYTVHGIFWHQGESDSGRTSEYSGLLTDFIERVRDELSMPNLRLVVGELAQAKPQGFRDVQWEVTQTVPNSVFISSAGLTTSDAATHFDTASMVTFGERLGYALRPDRVTLNFEAPTFAIGQLNRQDECAATLGLQVVGTVDQGEYIGGQAARHAELTGEGQFTRRSLLPLSGARSMQADFFGSDADSSLLVAAWGNDANDDGQFSDSEAVIGLGLHDTGVFKIQIGSGTHLSTSFSYQTDRWYRLTLTWSEPNAGGQRTVNLFARDLANGVDLNGGASILSLTVGDSEFAGDPVRWTGIGGSATRGLIDNLSVSPSGFAAWSSTLYPTLTGGLQDDDDKDGIVNAIEFAFGLDPLSASPASALPQPVFGQTSAVVSFAPLPNQPGTFYQIEWSRNLQTWTSVTGIRSGELIEFTVPTTNESRIFLRHQVEVSE